MADIWFTYAFEVFMSSSVCLECKSGCVVRVTLALIAAFEVSRWICDQEVIVPEIELLRVSKVMDSALRDC